MKLEEFMEDFNSKYGDIMKRLAHKSECEFRITVYERSSDFIAILDNDKAKWESGRSINDCIRKIKKSFPEVDIESEDGVKYYPLNKYYA